MPTHIVIDDEDLERLEEFGGLEAETVKTRETNYNWFVKYVESDGFQLEELFSSEDGRDKFCDLFSRFFFSLRVKSKDDGTEKLPKKAYAEKIKSNIKIKIGDEHKVDVYDPVLFPTLSNKWKAFVAELVKKRRAEVEHHEEVDPITMESIFVLLANVKEAIEKRGTKEYEDILSRIPADYHEKLNYLLMWGAQLILTLYEVRRGGEGLEELKKKDFNIIEDRIYDFKYIRKMEAEKEKNHKEGSNSACHGVIPYLDLAEGFNPGQFMEFYMSLVPDKSTKTNVEGGFLFQTPRRGSLKFKLHDAGTLLYEPNKKVGRNMVYGMLPQLCAAVGRPRQTNHCVRATAVMYMRRAGLEWETIIKITGHSSTVTLVKSYDLRLEAPGLARVSHAIGTGAKHALGEEVERVTLKTRKRQHTEVENSVEDIVPKMTKMAVTKVVDVAEGGPTGVVSTVGVSREVVNRPESLVHSMASVMGALAKNIMEGAAPMVNSLIMANMQEVCISNAKKLRYIKVYY